MFIFSVVVVFIAFRLVPHRKWVETCIQVKPL